MTVNKVENRSLRPVTAKDAKLLFDWTNEAETRKNSFSSEPVLWENHVQWLDKKLADKNCLFFIMMLNGNPVGTVRLDMDEEGKTGTISYSIDKQFRGMGLGGRILALVEEKAKEAGLHSLDMDEEGKTGTISYSIDKQFRGMGLGGRILALVEEKAKEAGLHSLVGGVKPENKASGKCFLKNGYELVEESSIELVYRKKI